MQKIQMALSNFGARLFRNQVGLYKLDDGRRISSGLGPGSSDLIGYTMVQVSPDMVGRRVAIFTAVEVKHGNGKLRPNQENFIQVINRAGGVAFVARTTEEAISNLIKGAPIKNGSGL
jgi:hypothetical protein